MYPGYRSDIFYTRLKNMKQKKKEESNDSNKAEANFPNRRRNHILAVYFAVVAMVG